MIENNFFFIAKVFFLKASFISALTIAVNIIFFKSIPCCFAHLRFQGICLWHSVLKRERKYERVVLCFFVLFWMLLFFIYNVLKRKVSCLLQISSFHKILVYFKKASCAAYWELGTSLLLYSSHLFAPVILLCKSASILPGRHSLSHEKKKLTTLVYLFETKKYESSIF